MTILDVYSDVIWEQRRYEIAKDMFVKYIGDCKITSDDDIMKRGESMSRYMARMSVKYADTLISELKNDLMHLKSNDGTKDN